MGGAAESLQLRIRVNERAVTADRDLERHRVHLSAGIFVDVHLWARYSCGVPDKEWDLPCGGPFVSQALP